MGNAKTKLGVKAGQQVVLESFPDPVLRDQFAARSARMVDRAASRAADVAFLGVSARADLRRISTLRRSLTPSGALWVLWAKGRQELTEGHVRDAARAAGLVDVKVVALSATHSALKLVVPRASRRGSIR